MFVGCSEISISVIVKHVQNIGIISRLFVFLGGLSKFSVPKAMEKIAGLLVCLGWYVRGGGIGAGISIQAETMIYIFHCHLYDGIEV